MNWSKWFLVFSITFCSAMIAFLILADHKKQVSSSARVVNDTLVWTMQADNDPILPIDPNENEIVWIDNLDPQLVVAYQIRDLLTEIRDILKKQSEPE